MAGTVTRWFAICCIRTAASRTKNWMLAWNPICHASFTLQPVQLLVCCKIAKLAGLILEAKAGQSACCLSRFFLWIMMSSSVCPLPKSMKWGKYSETMGSEMLIFCHFAIAWRETWNGRICGSNLSQVYYTGKRHCEAFGANKGEEACGVGRIAPNRAAAPRDSWFSQNELLCNSVIWQLGNSEDQRQGTTQELLSTSDTSLSQTNILSSSASLTAAAILLFK